MQYAYYNTSAGLAEIGFDDAVTSLRFVNQQMHHHSPAPLSDLAASELQAYLSGRRTAFDLPIRPSGTTFQMAVWQTLLDIPYGEIRSYGDIATAIGNPAASRAVGMACNRNPIWILIPCHRVVGRNRKLTGYAGGLELKQQLLNLEQQQKADT